MNRRLTADSHLDTLRKEAKRWLKALRAQDEAAHARLRRSYPTAAAQPGLRDVQHALAREHGLENWAALKAALEQNALIHKKHEERLAEFLEHSRLRHGTRPDTHSTASSRSNTYATGGFQSPPRLKMPWPSPKLY